MPDNDFWIGQEQIPVDLSLLLTYSNDEDYWYAPGEYALRVYTVDTLNTNFARPCFALGERTSDPEMEDVSGAIENTLHELLDSGATPEDVYRIMGLVKESELSPETKEADNYLPIDRRFPSLRRLLSMISLTGRRISSWKPPAARTSRPRRLRR